MKSYKSKVKEIFSEAECVIHHYETKKLHIFSIDDDVTDFSEEYDFTKTTTKVFKIYEKRYSRDVIAASIISENKAWKNAWMRVQEEILERICQ
jgi:hypothetical protein